MAPRPTPRVERPAPPAPRPPRPQMPTFNILGPVKDAMVSVVVFRPGDPPFDVEAPEPEFPLYAYNYFPS